MDKRKQKGEQTRKEIILAASHLFQTQGYSATSLSQLIDICRHPKGVIYFHFPGGKEEIAIAVVRMSIEEISELIREVFAESSSIGEVMNKICAIFAERLERSSYRNGCPITPLSTSSAEESKEIRSLCGDGYNRWQSDIEVCLANIQGLAIDPEPMASLLLSSIEGAVLLSQARGNTLALQSLPRTFDQFFV